LIQEEIELRIDQIDTMKSFLCLTTILISLAASAETQVSSPAVAPELPPSSSAPALEPVSAPSPFKIKWYKPAFQAGAPQGKVRTILSGRTEAGSQIDLGATEISVIQANGEVQSFKASDLKTNSGPVEADGNGYFELSLDLPQGDVQLPIHVALKENAKSYQLNLEVHSKSVVLKSPTELKASPALVNGASIWGGLGYTYVNMKQDIGDINSHVAFESFRAPSLFIEGAYSFGSNWGLIASYKKSPGAVGSPEGQTVQTGEYSWDILTLEGRYSKSGWKKMFFQKPAKFYLRFGANQQTVPFWERTTAQTVDIKTNQVMMASIGGQVDYDYSEKWVLTSLLRYDHVTSSDSSLKVEGPFSFDGSIGAYYRFDNRWNLGGFWYGQYHSWKFKHTDLVSNQEISGSQVLIFSNMEIRLGYGF
jgi:opacity protein-like surface antigen